MDDIYEKIEAYWKGNLKEPELSNFIQKMKEDPAFNQEVMLFKEVKEGIKSSFDHADDEDNLKETLSNIGDFHFNTKRNKPIRTRNRNIWLWTIASAAAIALLVFILQPSDLYDNYRAFPSANFTHKGDEKQNELRQKIEQDFNSKSYKQALEGIEELALKDDLEMEFYKGLIHLELNDFKKAMVLFNKISAGKSAYKHEATWYLALGYLKQEKWSECRTVLESINSENTHYKQAQKLLSKI